MAIKITGHSALSFTRGKRLQISKKMVKVIISLVSAVWLYGLRFLCFKTKPYSIPLKFHSSHLQKLSVTVQKHKGGRNVYFAWVFKCLSPTFHWSPTLGSSCWRSQKVWGNRESESWKMHFASQDNNRSKKKKIIAGAKPPPKKSEPVMHKRKMWDILEVRGRQLQKVKSSWVFTLSPRKYTLTVTSKSRGRPHLQLLFWHLNLYPWGFLWISWLILAQQASFSDSFVVELHSSSWSTNLVGQ